MCVGETERQSGLSRWEELTFPHKGCHGAEQGLVEEGIQKLSKFSRSRILNERWQKGTVTQKSSGWLT